MPISKIIEMRYDENGHKLRVFAILPDQHDKTTVSVQLSWGPVNPDTVGQIIKKYGPREVSMIVPSNEKWYHDVPRTACAQRLRKWRSGCKKDGGFPIMTAMTFNGDGVAAQSDQESFALDSIVEMIQG